MSNSFLRSASTTSRRETSVVRGCALGTVALLTLSCGQADNGVHRTDTLQPDGSHLVDYDRLEGPHLAVDTLATWDLMATEEYLFSQITSVVGAKEGYWFLDAGNMEIVRLTDEGRVVFHVGGEGDGPGEFRFPIAMATRQGEVWIADPTTYRYSVFGSNGAFLRSLNWTQSGPRTNGLMALNADGGILYEEQEMGSFAGVNVRNTKPDIMRLLRVNPDGQAPRDTLAAMPTLPMQLLSLQSKGGRTMALGTPPVFSPHLEWAQLPDGRIITVTTRIYRLEVRDGFGHVQLIIQAPTPDLVVTRRIEDSYLAAHPPFGLGNEEEDALDEASREAFPFAERRQAITGLAVDSVGRIWVLASTPDLDVNRVDLFTPEGDYLGAADGSSLPVAFSGDGTALLEGQTRSQEPVFYVVRLRADAPVQ